MSLSLIDIVSNMYQAQLCTTACHRWQRKKEFNVQSLIVNNSEIDGLVAFIHLERETYLGVRVGGKRKEGVWHCNHHDVSIECQTEFCCHLHRRHRQRRIKSVSVGPVYFLCQLYERQTGRFILV